MMITTVRVLHKHQYIDAHYVATKIRAIPRVCVARPYIDCVLAYNEATGMCAKFADAMNDAELRDPAVFLERVEELYDYHSE